jgi:hypothetical protein
MKDSITRRTLMTAVAGTTAAAISADQVGAPPIIESTPDALARAAAAAVKAAWARYDRVWDDHVSHPTDDAADIEQSTKWVTVAQEGIIHAEHALAFAILARNPAIKGRDMVSIGGTDDLKPKGLWIGGTLFIAVPDRHAPEDAANASIVILEPKDIERLD